MPLTAITVPPVCFPISSVRNGCADEITATANDGHLHARGLGRISSGIGRNPFFSGERVE